MFSISYVFIFDFHRDLNLDRIIIERSFGHSLKKLVSVTYLKRCMITYADRTTMQQLKDCAIKVCQEKYKQEISEVFTI